MSEADDATHRIRDLVRTAMSREVERLVPIEPGLGSRRFYRVVLTGDDAPKSVIARVEEEEDPSLRPAGVPPEPALEPIRAHLADHGVPVFDLYGEAPGLQLLEDAGDESLEDAARGRPIEAVHDLYREAYREATAGSQRRLR